MKNQYMIMAEIEILLDRAATFGQCEKRTIKARIFSLQFELRKELEQARQSSVLCDRFAYDHVKIAQ